MISNEKTLSVVGVCEDDSVRLCLLLRRITPRLEGCWHWGVENGADLIIADPSNSVGRMAWMRARARGVRCAVLQHPGCDNADYILARPFDAGVLAAALNDVTRDCSPLLGLEPRGYSNYFDTETADFEPTRGNVNAGVAEGLEEFLLAHTQDQVRARPTTLPPVASPRLPPEHALSAAPVNGQVEQKDAIRPSRPALSLVNRHADDGHAVHSLRSYLTNKSLLAPHRLDIPGLRALVLDPDNQVFHSQGHLQPLQAHCGVDISLSQWSPVSAEEMARLRQQQPARPYAKLLWLDAFSNADGKLKPHLDPMAEYRIKKWMDIDASMPRQQRIAKAMARAGRLDDVAETSGTTLAEVVDVVCAFDAIGYLESTFHGARDAVTDRGGERIDALVSRVRLLVESHGREDSRFGEPSSNKG